MCVCVHSHKVSADFYDPARRVGAEVKHVKNVKELYMVHDYIQRVTRIWGAATALVCHPFRWRSQQRDVRHS